MKKDTYADTSWTVIGRDICPYTTKAVQLLKSRDENVKYIPLNMDWRNKLARNYPTVNRVPIIYRGSRYFGSYGELKMFFEASFFNHGESEFQDLDEITKFGLKV